MLSTHFLDVVRGLPTLRAFNRGPAQAERIAAVADEYRRTTMGTLRVAFLSGAVLDLAATQFRYVVIDMPRTWFAWTDSVLLGSNKLFVVCELTVPGLKQAKQLVAAIKDRLADGPKPQVIVNRFEQRMFGPGLRRSDVETAFGADLAATVPNSYRLVREAIDRGVPLEEVKKGNKITQQLKKLIVPQGPGTAAKETAVGGKKLKLSWARS